MSAPDLRGLAERLDKATIRASGFCTRKPDCPYCEVRRLMNEILAALAGPEDGARSAWDDAAHKVAIYALQWFVGEDERGRVAMPRQLVSAIRAYHAVAVYSGKVTDWREIPAPPVASARPSGEQEGK